MKVNLKTLMFEDMTDEEAEDLYVRVRALVLKGEGFPLSDPFFQTWVKAGGYDERQALMMFSTAYPQRALLSIVAHNRGLTFL